MHLNFFKIRICTVLAEYSPWISEAPSVGFGSLPLLSKRVSPLWRVPGNDTMNEKHHWQTRLSTRARLQKKARNTTFQLYVNHFARPLVQSVSSKESLSAYCMLFPLPNPRAFTRWSMGTSLAVQWLGLCLPMQATWARFLVWEDCTCRGAAKPGRHDHWSLWAESPCFAPREATVMRSPQTEEPLLATARESPRKSRPRPSTAKKNK